MDEGLDRDVVDFKIVLEDEWRKYFLVLFLSE
jgi:hypothetical protein